MNYEDVPEHPDEIVADLLLDRLGMETGGDETNFLAKEASTPLYTSCRSNCLSIILQFLKVQARHTMSNVCMDEIFEIIANHIIDLELESKMPKIRVEGKLQVNWVLTTGQYIHVHVIAFYIMEKMKTPSVPKL